MTSGATMFEISALFDRIFGHIGQCEDSKEGDIDNTSVWIDRLGDLSKEAIISCFAGTVVEFEIEVPGVSEETLLQALHEDVGAANGLQYCFRGESTSQKVTGYILLGAAPGQYVSDLYEELGLMIRGIGGTITKITVH